MPPGVTFTVTVTSNNRKDTNLIMYYPLGRELLKMLPTFNVKTEISLLYFLKIMSNVDLRSEVIGISLTVKCLSSI